MSHKELFVDGDILDGHDSLLALQFEYAINEQQGIAMRQNFQQVVDVEPGLCAVRLRFAHG